MTSVLYCIQGRWLWAAAASGRLNKIEWRWRRREKDEESRTKWESFIEGGKKREKVSRKCKGSLESDVRNGGRETRGVKQTV